MRKIREAAQTDTTTPAVNETSESPMSSAPGPGGRASRNIIAKGVIGGTSESIRAIALEGCCARVPPSMSKPALRRQQMREALDFLERTGEPAVFAGDLNTTGADGRNLTVARMLKARVSGPGRVAELAGRILLRHVPSAGWGNSAFDAFRWVKRLEDPTSRFSAERGLFEDVRKRVGSRPINERDAIGYKHTWVPGRALMGGVLDWMFVYDPGCRLHVRGAATREACAEGVSDYAPVEVQLSPRLDAPE